MSIVEIGSIISALTFIAGTCWKTFSVCHAMLTKIEEFEKAQKKNEMYTMKMGLFNEGLPLQDRIKCGKRYLELGGNGTGTVQYEKLLKRMEDVMDNHKEYL